MSVKSLVLTCDWCTATEEIKFDVQPEDEEEFVIFRPRVPSWLHLEHEDEEKDYCCLDCLLRDLS